MKKDWRIGHPLRNACEACGELKEDQSNCISNHLVWVPKRQIVLPVITKRNRRPAKVVVVPEVVSELAFEGSDFRPQRPMMEPLSKLATAMRM